MMAKVNLDFVHRYMKGGREYIYFRRGDVRVRLPGPLGSKAFNAAYAAALEQKPLPIGAAKTVPGSMGALAAAWYASQGFTRLKAPSTNLAQPLFVHDDEFRQRERVLTNKLHPFLRGADANHVFNSFQKAGQMDFALNDLNASRLEFG